MMATRLGSIDRGCIGSRNPTTRLVVATLPYSEFAFYFEANDYDRFKAEQESRDKQLGSNAWTRKTYGDSEIRDPWLRIDHKYFAVTHREI